MPPDDGIGLAYDYLVPVDSIVVVGGRTSEMDSLSARIGHPVQVSIGGDGKFYVADAAFMAIKVYDSDLTYLQSIGGRGRGPGEFLDFTSMFGSDSGLVVSDEFNQRITFLSFDGRSKETRQYAHTDILWPRQAFRFDNGNLLFSYRIASADVSNKDSLRMFHIYDENVNEKLSSFGLVTDFLPKGEFPNIISFLEAGVFRVTTDGRVVYAPAIYSGRLFVYDPMRDLSLSQVFESRVTRSKAYVEIDRNLDPRPRGAMIISGITRTAGVIKRQTVGLFIDENDSLIHVSSIEADGEWHYFEEVFGSDGVSKGIGYIAELSGAEVLQGISTVQFRAFAGNRRYYITDISDGSVKIVYTNRGL